ncbi:divergent polysaccharide deacetylase family protein [Paenibacillus dendritiformis]|uniref:divergent polysaccharide deacetylase family protein n=1 Tax=Paenibacillus dendritiformis TaxID=130049 RepID=UPI00248B1E68|nr:divergent polysaccharide deacetylase family protein [Paenibacillus dendritiformis]WGU96526.1 divergent polysaccharide deacetylase family protein [Paenibacillus dendritiformis]
MIRPPLFMAGCRLMLALIACLLPGTAAAEPEKTAVIVIDDFGNNGRGTQEIIDLPFKVTVAVMPFLKYTKSDAERAHAAGHEVIVHMPMEALAGKKTWLGPGAITVDLSEDEIRKRVHAAIDDVPHAVGMNNHMGSKVTVEPRVMRVILEVCKERGIYFLDSHTNFRSVVAKVAEEVNIPLMENHIFLDDIHKPSAIRKQFMKMKEHLNDHNICVAIGHVGSAGHITAAIVKKQMLQMSQEQITFKKVSEVLPPSIPVIPHS